MVNYISDFRELCCGHQKEPKISFAMPLYDGRFNLRVKATFVCELEMGSKRHERILSLAIKRIDRMNDSLYIALISNQRHKSELTTKYTESGLDE